jgi:hypothetical protein
MRLARPKPAALPRWAVSPARSSQVPKRQGQLLNVGDAPEQPVDERALKRLGPEDRGRQDLGRRHFVPKGALHGPKLLDPALDGRHLVAPLPSVPGPDAGDLELFDESVEDLRVFDRLLETTEA